MTGSLVLWEPLDPGRVPRPDGKPPEPEPHIVLPPRSVRFLSARAPYRTMVSRPMWMYLSNQPQITTGGLHRNENRHRHRRRPYGRVRTSEASTRTHRAGHTGTIFYICIHGMFLFFMSRGSFKAGRLKPLRSRRFVNARRSRQTETPCRTASRSENTPDRRGPTARLSQLWL